MHLGDILAGLLSSQQLEEHFIDVNSVFNENILNPLHCSSVIISPTMSPTRLLILI